MLITVPAPRPARLEFWPAGGRVGSVGRSGEHQNCPFEGSSWLADWRPLGIGEHVQEAVLSLAVCPSISEILCSLFI